MEIKLRSTSSNMVAKRGNMLVSTMLDDVYVASVWPAVFLGIVAKLLKLPMSSPSGCPFMQASNRILNALFYFLL